MMLVQFLFVLIALFEGVTSQSTCPSNRGCFCLHGKVSPATGDCECTPNYFGADCGLDMSPGSGNTFCGTNMCQGGPKTVCYNNNKCYCDGESYGDLCQYKKESITCTQDTMTVSIAMNPKNDMEWQSEKYIDPNPKCSFVNAPVEIGGWYVYNMTLNLKKRSKECSKAVFVETHGNTKTYKIRLRVRITKGHYSPNDWTTDFTCNYTAMGTPSYRDVTMELNPFEFAITDMYNNPTQMIQKGQAYNLLFYLTTLTEKIRNITIDSISVFNQATNEKTMDFFTKGTAAYAALIGGQLRKNTPEYLNVNGSFIAAARKVPYTDAYSTHYFPGVRILVAAPNEYFPKSLYFHYLVKICSEQDCGLSSGRGRGGPPSRPVTPEAQQGNRHRPGPPSPPSRPGGRGRPGQGNRHRNPHNIGPQNNQGLPHGQPQQPPQGHQGNQGFQQQPPGNTGFQPRNPGNQGFQQRHQGNQGFQPGNQGSFGPNQQTGFQPPFQHQQQHQQQQHHQNQHPNHGFQPPTHNARPLP